MPVHSRVSDSGAAILARRLANQKLAATSLRTAAEVVSWLGAVQAQEYGPAKWALGQRAVGVTDADVEQAFTDGAILRTHVMRPTWHFVTPQDIRWMLALTAPRIDARMTPYNRHLELDRKLFSRSHDAIARALEGGRALTRAELAEALARVGIQASTQRLAHLMMQAELDRVATSGPRRGKQFTYALFDERVPPAPPRQRDEALAELAGRYFASHGPATIRDFAWWSGLAMVDAKRAAEAALPALQRSTVDAQTYWSLPSTATASRPRRATYLLPVYDEYLIAYKDRAIAIDPRTRGFDPSKRDDFGHYIVIDGRFTGSWRWVAVPEAISVRLLPYRRITAEEERSLRAVAGRLGAFTSARVTIGRRREPDQTPARGRRRAAV